MSWEGKYNEGKSVYAGRIIRTLINTIYKHMTAVSKKCLFWCVRLLMHLIINTIALLKWNLLMLNLILMLNKMLI